MEAVWGGFYVGATRWKHDYKWHARYLQGLLGSGDGGSGLAARSLSTLLAADNRLHHWLVDIQLNLALLNDS